MGGFDQILNSWSTFFAHKKLLYFALYTTFVSICVSIGFTTFLEWNETRNGCVIDDYILNRFKSINTSVPIFVLTYLSVIVGVVEGVRNPLSFFTLINAILILTLLRTFSLLLFPLEPPVGMIPLRDFLLEGTFYSGKVLRKDLFFSGHTANVILFALLSANKVKKIILMVVGILVGALLMIQKAHYTIDVVMAPFFAYLAVLLAKKLTSYLFQQILQKTKTYHSD